LRHPARNTASINGPGDGIRASGSWASTSLGVGRVMIVLHAPHAPQEIGGSILRELRGCLRTPRAFEQRQPTARHHDLSPSGEHRDRIGHRPHDVALHDRVERPGRRLRSGADLERHLESGGLHLLARLRQHPFGKIERGHAVPELRRPAGSTRPCPRPQSSTFAPRSGSARRSAARQAAASSGSRWRARPSRRTCASRGPRTSRI
jgi:hypothetical protein